jgi:tripartite-type tricarboxylate transporter receptor subunit TctC
VLNNDLPAKTVPEFIALAKTKPGQLAYGTTGPGTPFHLYAELFGSMTGTSFVHVPYRAAVAGLADLMGGRLQFMMTDFSSSRQLIQEGKVRALGVTTKSRASAMPELAPIAELGVPGFDAAAWQMVVGPSAMPKPVTDKLHATLKEIMATDDAKQAIERIGLVPVATGSPAEMQAFVRSEIGRWGEVVKKSGASVE